MGGFGGFGGGGSSFGGGGGGGRGGGGMSNFFIGGSSTGLIKTLSTGLNYTDQWGSKIKVSGSYFFSDSKPEQEQNTFRQTFMQMILLQV